MFDDIKLKHVIELLMLFRSQLLNVCVLRIDNSIYFNNGNTMVPLIVFK